MEKYFKIGIITSSFGVKGEMKVYPTTDDPRRFKKLKEVFLKKENENESEMKQVKVESVRFSKEIVILKLEGIDTPEEVMKLRKAEFYVDREHAVPLRKDEYFIADLIGMQVRDEDGNEIGTIKDVFPTGANDVYQIEKKEGGEFLLPAIRQCVLDVQVEEGFMTVHILDGLLDE